MKLLRARNTAPLPLPRFADRLQDGERLLWEGRPDIRMFIQSGRIEAARFLLPLMPLILLLETRSMRLKRGRNGFGTIIFEKITRLTGALGQDWETYEFSFQHIADVEMVFGLIQAARFGYRAADTRG